MNNRPFNADIPPDRPTTKETPLSRATATIQANTAGVATARVRTFFPRATSANPRAFNQKPANHRRAFVTFTLAMLALFATASALALAPRPAQAADLRCLSEDIQATVETDGGIAIVEQRTYQLKPDQTTLALRLSQLRWGASVEVESVRTAPCDADGNPTGEWETLAPTPFQLTWRDTIPENGDAPQTPSANDAQPLPTAAFSYDDALQIVYLFLGDAPATSADDPADASADQTSSTPLRAIVVDYKARDAVELFEDDAQLNWTIVPADTPIPIENLTATIALPVPGIESTSPPNTDDAMHAWAHGPAQTTIETIPPGIAIIAAPRVIPGQYCEARVLFPATWLTSADADLRAEHEGALILDTALGQERQWSDQWRARRANDTIASLVLLVASAIALIVTLICYLAFGREYRRRYAPVTSWSDPARGLSPVIVNRLLRWNHRDFQDVALSVGRLIGEGAISAETSRTSAAPSSPTRSSREPAPPQQPADLLVCTAQTLVAPAEPVETATLTLLFGDLEGIVEAYGAPDADADAADPTMDASDADRARSRALQLDVEALAAAIERDREAAAAVRDAWSTWEQTVFSTYEANDYFERRSLGLQVAFSGLAIVWLAIAIAFGLIVNQWLPASGAILTAIAIGALAARMRRRTPVGDAIVSAFYELKSQFQTYIRNADAPTGDTADAAPDAAADPPLTLLPYAQLANLTAPTMRRLARATENLTGFSPASEPNRLASARAFYGGTPTTPPPLATRLGALFARAFKKS